MADSPINQKATLRRRMEEAGEGDEPATKPAAPAPAASAPAVRFTREYSPEERARQAKGLAEALKKRGY
jgi:hypothetical protein